MPAGPDPDDDFPDELAVRRRRRDASRAEERPPIDDPYPPEERTRSRQAQRRSEPDDRRPRGDERPAETSRSRSGADRSRDDRATRPAEERQERAERSEQPARVADITITPDAPARDTDNSRDAQHSANQPNAGQSATAAKGFGASAREERIQRRKQKLDPGERRYSLIIDIEGPKVRLGLLWLFALIGASVAGRFSVALLFGIVAVVAALQVAAHLMIEEDKRARVAAGAIAGLITVSAVGGGKWVGAAVLIAVAIAFGVSRQTPDVDYANDVMALIIRAGFFVGLAGASPVLVQRVDAFAYMYLIFAVSGYEAGSFLIGSNAKNQLQGPIAGAATVALVGLGASAFEFPPLTERNTWVFAGMFALLCPLGQLLGTALLPRADAVTPALRRIDSYLLAGPAYVVGLWIALANR